MCLSTTGVFSFWLPLILVVFFFCCFFFARWGGDASVQGQSEGSAPRIHSQTAACT